tara:strand:- start:19 stop:246 length:228 start_codon:yes stop_codon:yes gene_type:complete
MYTEYLSWNHYWRSKTSSLTSKTQRESYFFNNHENDDEEYYNYLMSKKEMEKTDKKHEGNHEYINKKLHGNDKVL